MSPIRPSDSAPDLSLVDHDGNAVRLADLWAPRPVVLFFLRHLACPCSREQVVDLRPWVGKLEGAGGEVVAVTMGSEEQTAEYRRSMKAAFRFLADPDRAAYRAYGLERGTAWQVYGPGVWLAGAKALLRGGTGKPAGDVRQLPGTFVIDRQGTVRFAHYPRNQAEKPSLEEIAAVLESLGA